MHRWTWDIHYAAGADAGGGRGGRGGGGGLWAVPGKYSVKLAVDGKSYTQPLTVKMDPQVKAPLPELQRQFDFAQQVSAKSAEVARARGEVTAVRAQITSLRTQVGGNSTLSAALDALDAKAATIGGVVAPSTPDSSGVAAPSADVTSLMFVGGELGQVLQAVEGPDSAPSQQVTNAFAKAQKLGDAAMAKWTAVKNTDLATVNNQLKQANLTPISLEGASPAAGRGRRGQ
jgi:hypothetical protein